MHVRAYLPSRLLPGIGLLFVVGAVVVTWGIVVRTLREVRPVTSPGRPSAVVWGDRVFQSPGELGRWLRSRGGSYEAWSHTHPKARATLEHRPIPTAAAAARTTTSQAVRKAAPTVKTAAPSKPAHVAATSVAPAKSAFAQFMIVLLACVATLCLAAAGLPASVGRHVPALGRLVVGNRPFLLAASAAVYVGLVVGLMQG